MTAEEFANQYAHNSGITTQALAETRRVVVKCECDYEGCQGWAMVNREIVESLQAEGIRYLGGADYSQIHWPKEVTT